MYVTFKNDPAWSSSSPFRGLENFNKGVFETDPSGAARAEAASIVIRNLAAATNHSVGFPAGFPALFKEIDMVLAARSYELKQTNPESLARYKVGVDMF